MTIDTQLQAYAAINESRAAFLRTRVKTTLASLEGGATSEELAIMMREDYASVQPRTSELHDDYVIFDNGQRRLNASGKKAIVWQLVRTEHEQQLAIKQTMRKMKPIGDKKLFGEMMRSIYAYEAQETPENMIQMTFALQDWAEYMVKSIRVKKATAKENNT